MRTVCCLALVVLLSGCSGPMLVSQQDTTSPSKPKPRAEWQERISTLCSAEAMRLEGMPANGRHVSFAEVQQRCLRREYRMHRWERLTWWLPRQTAEGL